MSVDVVEIGSLKNSPEFGNDIYGHTCTCVESKYFYIYGGSSSNGKFFNNKMYIFDCSSLPLKWLSQSFSNRFQEYGIHFHTCCFYQKSRSLFIFGGKRNGYSNKMFRFNILSNKFSVVKSKQEDKTLIPNARYGHSTCIYSDSMFVFGGYDCHGMSNNTLYEFNLKESKWVRKILLKEIPHRYHHAGILLKDQLYIFGGLQNNNKALSDCYRINLSNITQKQKNLSEEEEEGEGEQKKHLVTVLEGVKEDSKPCYGLVGFLWNSNIFLYGGRENFDSELKRVLMLDLYEEQWVECSFPWNKERPLLAHCTVNVFTIIEDSTHHFLLMYGGQKSRL